MEGAGERGAGEESRSRAHEERQEDRLRSTRGSSGETTRADTRAGETQGSLPVPLHRQGQSQARRRSQHRDRQGDVRPGRAPARHVLRGRRAAAGVSGQGGERRCLGDDEGTGRGEGGADRTQRTAGDFDGAMAKAAKKVEAEYYLPHLAHATMEPPAAAAQIKGGKCEVWSSVQSPQAARDLVAKRLGIDPSNVKVNVTLLGGGFGRKSKPDFCIEAAVVSKAMDGAPVKVVWTREDDLRHDYLHTVSVERLEAGLDENGKCTAWMHRSVAPTILSTFVPDAKNQFFIELGMSLLNVAPTIPNVRIENPEAEAHTRIGWFRSVSNVPHAFAIQSFIAEMAAAAGKDQKDYLLEVIGPARRVSPETLGDTWNHGESPERYP